MEPDKEASDGSLAFWLADLDQRLESDPITLITLQSLMAWAIKRSIPDDEIDTIIDMVMRRLRVKMMADYNEAVSGPIEDLQLPEREEFTVTMNDTLRQAQRRIKGLFGGNHDIPGTHRAGP